VSGFLLGWRSDWILTRLGELVLEKVGSEELWARLIIWEELQAKL